jgi:hypothetical protein
MAKTDVYSWRISRAHKTALEHIAREERVSLAQLLDRVTGQWITARTGAAEGADDEQTRLRATAGRFVGAIAGRDPERAARARERLQKVLKARRGR